MILKSLAKTTQQLKQSSSLSVIFLQAEKDMFSECKKKCSDLKLESADSFSKSDKDSPCDIKCAFEKSEF